MSWKCRNSKAVIERLPFFWPEVLAKEDKTTRETRK